MIPLVIIAAIADNGVIGRAGALPWRLRSDLQHFRALTLGHPVVMGRKTYESIGRALPGRTNIAVSRDRAFTAPGLVIAANFDAALAVARGDALRRGAGATMVIGGADIYAQAMPLASRLEITHVHMNSDGDTVFPAIDPGEWQEVARQDMAAGQGDDAAFAFVSYERVASAPHRSASPRRKPVR